MKLTARQIRMLREMAALPADKAWGVSGHNRGACSKLVTLGYAIKVGDYEMGLSSAYRITPAGRTALQERETK